MTSQNFVVFSLSLRQTKENILEGAGATGILVVNPGFLPAPLGAALQLTLNFGSSKKHKEQEIR